VESQQQAAATEGGFEAIEPATASAEPSTAETPQPVELAGATSARTAAVECTPASRDVVVLRIFFEILRVDLPRESGRDQLKVWNHLNESLGDPGLTALLARNGLRIGMGDDESWPALRAIFENGAARTSHADKLAESGAPIILPLGEVETGATYFVHRRAAGLEGGTFPPGQMQVQVDFALDERDPTRIALRVVPRLEESRSRMRVVDQGGDLMTIQDQPAQVFEELTASLNVGPGQYIVLGRSAEAKPAGEGYLLGSWWFTARLGADTYETLLCIKPQLMQVSGAASAQAPTGP
jgi:hypothetical protein